LEQSQTQQDMQALLRAAQSHMFHLDQVPNSVHMLDEEEEREYPRVAKYSCKDVQTGKYFHLVACREIVKLMVSDSSQ